MQPILEEAMANLRRCAFDGGEELAFTLSNVHAQLEIVNQFVMELPLDENGNPLAPGDFFDADGGTFSVDGVDGNGVFFSDEQTGIIKRNVGYGGSLCKYRVGSGVSLYESAHVGQKRVGRNLVLEEMETPVTSD